MALSQTSVLKLYNTVIEDVISGVREAFLDEGVDEQVLQELKQIWETKLMASKAVELNPEPPEPQPPQLVSKNISSNKSGLKRNSNVQTNANVQSQVQESSPPRPQAQQPQQASPPQPTHIQNQQSQLQPQPQAQPQQIQAQSQQVQHMQNMPVQQIQQHHQTIPQTQQPHVNQQAAAVPADRQISIQIKLPIHGQLPERLITVHVPASAVQGSQLHALFTGPIISAAISLPTPFATSLLQQHVNSTFEGVPGFTPVQVQPVHVVDSGSNNIMQQQLIQGQAHGNIAQLDGIAEDPFNNDDIEVTEESSKSSRPQLFAVRIKVPSYNQKPGRVVTLHYPTSILQGLASNQMQQAFPGPVTSAAHELPSCSMTFFSQLVNSQHAGHIIQLDGVTGDSSDEEDDDEEEDNDDDEDPDEDREEEDDENDDSGAREEEPLNSEDDVTDEDPTDLFDTENVVVCQYDKITRSRNKWKFYLKDGIMNLSGKDFVFQKANGDAEW
ncbi:transcription initiation factor IIA subunit 1 [Phymastichus coffea]|uniref:transcription initiation factor IIA subunit 1 n=1 Tax=Phymastichus coffea TaxID=108790 RepID=UPI00273A7A4E|nr:transcription initiation factor IIA subunit 1 [Phymastichus coffea]